MPQKRQQSIKRYASYLDDPRKRWLTVGIMIIGVIGFLLVIYEGHLLVREGIQSGSTAFERANTNTSPTSSDPTITLSGDQQLQPNEYEQSPSLGPMNAPITIYEFGDFDCTACAAAYSTLQDVLTAYGDRIHYAWKDFPLTFHLTARAAANAARCAQEQGKFWEMKEYLFSFDGDVTTADLDAVPDVVALDADQYAACQAAQTYDNVVDRDFVEAVDLQVTGTPYYFINGVRVEGGRSYSDMVDIIEQSLTETP